MSNLIFTKQESLCISSGTPKNVLVQGDNLDFLAMSKNKYAGKVGLIYIDPPYNKHSTAFRYSDSQKRPDWIEFMRQRLELSKAYLAPNGFIVISIDDSEYPYLRCICDTIFGEDKYIATIVWETKVSRSNRSQGINCVHEYILVYGNGPDSVFRKLPMPCSTKEKYKNPDNDPRGPWITKPLWAKSNTNKEQALRLPDGTMLTKKWFVCQETFDTQFKNNEIYKTEKGLYTKVFLKTNNCFVTDTFWTPRLYQDDPVHYCGSSSDGTAEIKELFDGKNIFIHPKPLALLKKIIRLSTDEDSLVIDFFAGSGTTGQAVLELNQEDGGHRRFILCTNNDNNICREVCYERLKKSLQGYGEHSATKGSLDYFIITNASIATYKKKK